MNEKRQLSKQIKKKNKKKKKKKKNRGNGEVFEGESRRAVFKFRNFLV
jgi:hypothetical protein